MKFKSFLNQSKEKPQIFDKSKKVLVPFKNFSLVIKFY